MAHVSPFSASPFSPCFHCIRSVSYLLLLIDDLCSICVLFLVCFRLPFFCLLIIVNYGAFCVESSVTVHRCEISWNSMYLGRKVRGDFILVWIVMKFYLKFRTSNISRAGNNVVDWNGSRIGLGFRMCIQIHILI